MTTPRTLRLLAVLAVALATSASGDCGGITGYDCTAIGCSDGLLTTIEGDIAGPVTVRVTDGEREETGSCESLDHCLAFFDDWTPAQVQIGVAWEGGAVSHHATPSYEKVRPNGRRCPPECLQAGLVVTVP